MNNGLDRLAILRKRFHSFVLDGIPALRRLGYNPTEFLEMVKRYVDAVGATKHLLADPRHTSYGFQRLYKLGKLESSVEFAACLPWFEELFEPHEITEARIRLVTHDFPLDARLAAATARPPEWLADL
ncbi:MAG TPA: hypothetical protein VFB84_01145 [Micromonosporaceae bacterium]|nr:hypothetical protein [Micromonosporaceae bacterium]